MEPAESNAARITGRFLFIAGCSANFGGVSSPFLCVVPQPSWGALLAAFGLNYRSPVLATRNFILAGHGAL